MNLNLFPTMPTNPFAVREATIEWSHQLAAQDAAAEANEQYLAAVQAERLEMALPLMRTDESKMPTNRGKNFAHTPRSGTHRPIGGEHDHLPDRRARGARRLRLGQLSEVFDPADLDD